jgi:hypothetical protein
MEVKKFINCTADSVKSCMPGVDMNMLIKLLGQRLTEDLMCEKAGLQFPGPTGQNLTIPCTINVTEYTNRVNKCSDPIVKKWTTNKADPSLCRLVL